MDPVAWALLPQINIPFVEHRQMILAILVPFRSSFEIVLIVEATANRRSPGKRLTDIVPFLSFASEFDNDSIFLRRPFRLAFGWW